jgi:diguanylate cyclase (GGDEF)-like protein
VPAVAVLTVIYVAWTQVEVGGAAVTIAFSDILIGLAAAAAGVACVAASRRQVGWAGRGWLSIGLGMLFWAVGEAIWTDYEVILGREVPFPSLADAGFLLMVPLTLAGMAAMLNFKRSALRTLLDAFTVTGSLLFVSWPTVLEPTYRADGQGLLERSIALAYPIGDIIVASMTFVLLSQTARQMRGTLALAGAGMLGLAVADSGFAYLTIHNAYVSASVIDPGWFVGFLLIALAGLRMYHTRAEPQPRPDAPLLVALPYVPLAAALVTATTVQVTRGTLGTFLYVALMFLVGVVVLRQLVTLQENRTLTRQLHATVNDLRSTEEELRHRAYYDPLTGLANRAMLQDRTERAAERQRREATSVGILYIDLDDFKQINDGLGHPAGDALLIMAADRLRECTRPVDTIARIGGDEFVMLLDGLVDERDAEITAERIVAELARPFTIDGRTVGISASVGVAVQHAGGGDAGDLLRDADIAMYNAKFSGKNNLVCFDSVLRDRIIAQPTSAPGAAGGPPSDVDQRGTRTLAGLGGRDTSRRPISTGSDAGRVQLR